MSPETEDERLHRIRDSQMRNRSYDPSLKPIRKAVPKKQAVPKRANTPSWTTQPGLLHIPPGAARDIIIGLAFGFIPTLLALILLPEALKGLALVVLGISGMAGFLIGTPTSK